MFVKIRVAWDIFERYEYSETKKRFLLFFKRTEVTSKQVHDEVDYYIDPKDIVNVIVETYKWYAGNGKYFTTDCKLVLIQRAKESPLYLFCQFKDIELYVKHL